MIRLEADDPRVRERTVAALRASRGEVVESLTIHCAGRCGAVLAKAGHVAPFGVLFTSSWAVPIASPFVDRVSTNEGEFTGDRATRFFKEHFEIIGSSGPPVDRASTHGVLALLALPPEMAADYPDLMVRCAKHGDLLLDRSEVLDWVRTRAKKVVKPDPDAHLRYRSPDPAFGVELQHQTKGSETRRWPRSAK